MKYLNIIILLFALTACDWLKKEIEEVTINNETPIEGTYSDKKVGDKQLFKFDSNSSLGLPIEEFYRVDGVRVDNDSEYEHTFDKKGMTRIEGVAKTEEDSSKVVWDYKVENTSTTAIDTSITMLEDGTTIIAKDDLLYDADGDETSLNITGTDNVSASVNANGDLQITGLENYFGNASINYNGSDGESNATGQISIDFTPVDDPPTATNVSLTPLEAFVGDTVKTSNGYYDVEGDLQGGRKINKYINGILAGSTEENTPTDDLQPNDKIKTGVIVYDVNGIEGEEVFSNEITLQASPYRTISGTILEHWSQIPDEGVRIITSVGETLTDANGEYSVQASTDEEHILALKDQRLESGFIITAGQNDIEYNHTLSNDTKENGIDRWLFKNYVLKKVMADGLGRAPGPPDGAYVALTEESVPDTAWILGKMTRTNGTISSVGFQTLGQINLLGKKINEDLEEATNGLFSENNTIIAIADSNYIGAQFDYPNMIAVQNSVFNLNLNNLDYIRQSFYIQASATGVGFNNANYEDDEVTIKGGQVTIHHDANLNTSGIFNTEAYAMILGDVETPDGYESVLGPGGRTIYPHDTRITNWTITRGPGHWYPDFPKNFNPELINQNNQD